MKMDIIVILKSLLFCLFIFLFPGTYALTIVVSLFYLNLGIFSLPYAFGMTAPMIIMWVYVQRKKAQREYDSLMKPPQIWDTDTTAKEYVELLGKHAKSKRA